MFVEDISIVKDSKFEKFFIEKSLFTIDVGLISIESCIFINNSCTVSSIEEHISLIHFLGKGFNLSHTMFSQCYSNWGALFIFASSIDIRYFAFNESNLFKIESNQSGGLIGSREKFECQENNFSRCFSNNDRTSAISFDTCFDMTARFLQFESSNCTVSLIEIYHDDKSDLNNYWLTIKDTNIFDNHNQRSYFHVKFRNTLKLKLQHCHFVKNDQCKFYSISSSNISNLQVKIEETNFDIKREDIVSGNFNLGTDGIIFGENNTYLFERIVYGNCFRGSGSCRNHKIQARILLFFHYLII